MKQVFSSTLSGRELKIETGQIADFANGSVLVRYGDTVILSTATSAEPREGIDFFPLSVDYEEKMYSVGKIPGGFLRREGRPSENAILTARLIDRPLRPLFPDDLRNDVNVNNLVLCVDHDNSPRIAAMLGSSIALSISDIPWGGPVAGVEVGLVDGEIIVNPDFEEKAKSKLDLTVAGTVDKICMIEAGAEEVPDDVMLEAIAEAHKVISEMCKFIISIKETVGKEKFSYTSYSLPAEFEAYTKEILYKQMQKAVMTPDKQVRDKNISELKSVFQAFLEDQGKEDCLPYIDSAIDALEKQVVREYLKQNIRVDGRGMNDIRDLHAEIDILPRTHGSSLFSRGGTQVLSVCTLGTLAGAQKLDGVDPQEEKRYMHHYNFPGYSVGEARPNRSPGRREIGHGALAERALLPVLPSEEEFPYAIRCVSEVTMSNGSTSQGSVCASSLSLMAAGVPIKRPVAGISSGLISNPDDPDDYTVFMDIQGLEDFFGDMDFKVAGTEVGITAIQVDIKVDGLTLDMIKDAFAITRKGRLQVLNECMKPVIAAPREEISEFAPKITQIDIPSDKIREVIGSGGKVIKRLTEETECEIEIEEDGDVGHVYIASPGSKNAMAALKQIELIVNDPEPGSILDGTVMRIMNFGAFVEYAPGKEGLVHISKLADEHVERVEDIVEIGDEVKVRVIEIDNMGRVNLSMRESDMTGDFEAPRKFDKRGGGKRRDDRGGSRGGYNRNRRNDSGRQRSYDSRKPSKDRDYNTREF